MSSGFLRPNAIFFGDYELNLVNIPLKLFFKIIASTRSGFAGSILFNAILIKRLKFDD